MLPACAGSRMLCRYDYLYEGVCLARVVILDKNKFAARRSRCAAKINSMSHSHRKGGGGRRFAVGLTHHPTNWLGRPRGGTARSTPPQSRARALNRVRATAGRRSRHLAAFAGRLCERWAGDPRVVRPPSHQAPSVGCWFGVGRLQK